MGKQSRGCFCISFKPQKRGRKKTKAPTWSSVFFLPAGLRSQGQAPSSGDWTWDVLLPAPLAAHVLSLPAPLPPGGSGAGGHAPLGPQDILWCEACGRGCERACLHCQVGAARGPGCLGWRARGPRRRKQSPFSRSRWGSSESLRWRVSGKSGAESGAGPRCEPKGEGGESNKDRGQEKRSVWGDTQD